MTSDVLPQTKVRRERRCLKNPAELLVERKVCYLGIFLKDNVSPHICDICRVRKIRLYSKSDILRRFPSTESSVTTKMKVKRGFKMEFYRRQEQSWVKLKADEDVLRLSCMDSLSEMKDSLTYTEQKLCYEVVNGGCLKTSKLWLQRRKCLLHFVTVVKSIIPDGWNIIITE